MTFPPELASVTGSRRFTERWLGEWGCDALLADAQLLVSELVSNAVLHARTPITVSLALEGDRLRIEVLDGTDDPPEPAAVSVAAPSGRGLMIVDRLADRWGTDTRSKGKVVWCELVPADAS